MNYKFLILAALLFGFGCAEAADALNPVDIKEWTVSYGGRSRDPFAASANSVWFVGQSGHYLARLDAASGQFTRTDLPDNPGPHNLIVGADGIVWYSGNQAGYIGRYDPKTGGIEEIPMPDARADDPHTLVMSKSGKHFWFTLQWGNFVGRLTIASRKVDLFPVTSGNARPYGITVAPDGTPWIALLGTDKLASVDPKTLKLTEHDVAPGPGAWTPPATGASIIPITGGASWAASIRKPARPTNGSCRPDSAPAPMPWPWMPGTGSGWWKPDRPPTISSASIRFEAPSPRSRRSRPAPGACATCIITNPPAPSGSAPMKTPSGGRWWASRGGSANYVQCNKATIPRTTGPPVKGLISALLY
jgi:hypothetical protein